MQFMYSCEHATMRAERRPEGLQINMRKGGRETYPACQLRSRARVFYNQSRSWSLLFLGHGVTIALVRVYETPSGLMRVRSWGPLESVGTVSVSVLSSVNVTEAD